jgi:hypothetical protein
MTHSETLQELVRRLKHIEAHAWAMDSGAMTAENAASLTQIRGSVSDSLLLVRDLWPHVTTEATEQTRART